MTEPGAAETYTVPFEGVVQSVAVAAGEAVRAGAVLARLVPSPATRADLAQARLDAAAQEAAMRTVQERYDLHLATRQELEAQQATLAAARARLDALEGQTSGGTVTAQSAGVVDTVYAATGQTVTAGAPLVAVAASRGFQLTLGVEAEDVPVIEPGMTVQVVAVDRPDEVRDVGRVVRVEAALDPRTRLAQVIVALPGPNPFLLGEYVRGTFEGPTVTALVAPRDAILTTEDGPVAFTVAGGRAVRHVVEIVVENDRQTGFTAPGIRTGDSLVVSGLVQLSDSLRIRPIR